MNKYCLTIDDKLDLKDTYLTIGSFDGIHLGHLDLINKAKSLGEVSLLTFSMNMKSILRNKEPDYLLTRNQKIEKLESLGINNYIELVFDKKLKNSSKEEFISFLKSLNPNGIIIGKDFTFAKKAEGKAEDLNILKEEGIEIYILPLKEENGIKISSTEIKNLLKENKIEKANELLSYDFYYDGTVIHGKENGRKINFPTANMKVQKEKFKLNQGVYKTITSIDGKIYKSMTNIGNHPTIDKLDENIIETHVIDFDEDIYNKNIRVFFLSYIRDQMKFNSMINLKEQLEKDVKICKQ